MENEFTIDDLETITVSNDDALTITPPRYKIRVSEGFYVEVSKKEPNWFHRKMMSLFFGWEFEMY